MRGGHVRDRTRGGGDVIARLLTIGRWVLALSSVIACGVATPAAAAATDSAAHNRAAAHRAAARLLGSAMLPAGAVRVGEDPEAATRFSWLHTAVSDTPTGSNVIDLHRFFRVPGRPMDLFRWLNRHRPRGSKVVARGQASLQGRTVDWSVLFGFHAVRDTITQRGVGFEMTFARGGGTAVRVEGWAAWFVPRPAFERVPDSARAVAVSVVGPGSKLFPVSTITDPRSVSALIQFVNSRQLVQPDSETDCGPLLVPRLDLSFVPAVGAAPVARAATDGCEALSFSVGGRAGPPLTTGQGDVGNLLWKLHAVPVCAPGQLSGSATRAGRPDKDVRLMELRLTNLSQTVCGLEGFPQLRFRNAAGKPLSIGAMHLPVPVYAMILAPSAVAASQLLWGTLPECPLATSIDLTPPALATALPIAVGSPSHPMRPCDGTVFVSSFGVPLAKFLGIPSLAQVRASLRRSARASR